MLRKLYITAYDPSSGMYRPTVNACSDKTKGYDMEELAIGGADFTLQSSLY